MDENSHCPKCRTDLRHSLALHGDKLARCPYCAYMFSPAEGGPARQSAPASAITNAPPKSETTRQTSTTSAITNAPRSERPLDPITRKPLRGKHLSPDDNDDLPARKRIHSQKDRSAAVGILVGMAAGLALGIFGGGICTASMSGPVGMAISNAIYVGVGSMCVGAFIGGLVGYANGDHAEASQVDKRNNGTTR